MLDVSFATKYRLICYKMMLQMSHFDVSNETKPLYLKIKALFRWKKAELMIVMIEASLKGFPFFFLHEINGSGRRAGRKQDHLLINVLYRS